MGNGEGARGSQTTHISYLAFLVPIPMPFTILPFTLTVTIGLISKKKKQQFQSAALFFVHFFAVVLHDYNVKLPVTRFTEEMLYVFRFTFFHCCSFSPSWPLAFLIFSPPLLNFHVFVPTKLVFVVVVVAVVVVLFTYFSL